MLKTKQIQLLNILSTIYTSWVGYHHTLLIQTVNVLIYRLTKDNYIIIYSIMINIIYTVIHIIK